MRGYNSVFLNPFKWSPHPNPLPTKAGRGDLEVVTQSLNDGVFYLELHCFFSSKNSGLHPPLKTKHNAGINGWNLRDTDG